MDIHEIRLRGGWEYAGADGVAQAPTRITLPFPAFSVPAGRWQLIRRFNRPPRITSEAVEVRMRQVPGIESVMLNGLALGPISPECSEFDLAAGPLMPRNELVITATPPRIELDWGVVSLVFRESRPGASEALPVAPRP